MNVLDGFQTDSIRAAREAASNAIWRINVDAEILDSLLSEKLKTVNSMNQKLVRKFDYLPLLVDDFMVTVSYMK